MKALHTFLLALALPVLAFAHGDEDHSHDPAPATAASTARAAATAGQSRFETATETFEIVGQLHDGELSLLIDRFETNEPVLNAKVEVELSGRTAVAGFHADHGDYAVDDAAFLKALSAPGTHSLVMTVTSGSDTDLLEASMEVAGEQRAAEGRSVARVPLAMAAIAGILLTVVLAAIAIALARRKTTSGT